MTALYFRRKAEFKRLNWPMLKSFFIASVVLGLLKGRKCYKILAWRMFQSSQAGWRNGARSLKNNLIYLYLSFNCHLYRAKWLLNQLGICYRVLNLMDETFVLLGLVSSKLQSNELKKTILNTVSSSRPSKFIDGPRQLLSASSLCISALSHVAKLNKTSDDVNIHFFSFYKSDIRLHPGSNSSWYCSATYQYSSNPTIISVDWKLWFSSW